MTERDQALLALNKLLHLRLAIVSYAADMRGFCFSVPDLSSEPQWFLHIQCPWRIRIDATILTGSFDWYEPVPGFEPEIGWSPSSGGSLQELKLRKWMNDVDGNERIIRNRTEELEVELVDVDALGAVRIQLSAGYQLETWSSGSSGEFWRIFHTDDFDSDYVWIAA